MKPTSHQAQTIEPAETGKQARLVAVVIALTMLIWMGAQWIGGTYGLAVRYVYLFDLAAMAAFVWALVVTWQIWRRQKSVAREN